MLRNSVADVGPGPLFVTVQPRGLSRPCETDTYSMTNEAETETGTATGTETDTGAAIETETKTVAILGLGPRLMVTDDERRRRV